MALGGGGWCRPLSLAGARGTTSAGVGADGRERRGRGVVNPRRPHWRHGKGASSCAAALVYPAAAGSQAGSVESSKSPQLCLGPFEQQRFGRVRRDVLLSWHPPDGSGWHESVGPSGRSGLWSPRVNRAHFGTQFGRPVPFARVTTATHKLILAAAALLLAAGGYVVAASRSGPGAALPADLHCPHCRPTPRPRRRHSLTYAPRSP